MKVYLGLFFLNFYKKPVKLTGIFVFIVEF